MLSNVAKNEARPKRGKGRKIKKREVKMLARDQQLRDNGEITSVPAAKAAEVIVLQEKGARNRLFKGHPHLMRYAESLDDPFKVRGIKSPLSVNVAPTFFSTTASTTNFSRYTVALNTATQLYFFPGRSYAANVIGSSDYASHASVVTVNATNYLPGPVQESTYPPIMGVANASLAIGATATAFNVASATPIVAAQNLPYGGSTGLQDIRWRLVSMGVRIKNVTIKLNRGGSIVTCNPVHVYSLADYSTQNAYSVFKSFQQHEGDFAEVNWRPASKDLGFMQYELNIITTDQGATGLLVWLNGDAGQPQTYEVEVICNWELGGNALRTIVTPSLGSRVLSPVAQDAIEATGQMPTVTYPEGTQPPSLFQHAMNAAGKVAAALGSGAAAAKPVVAEMLPHVARLTLDHMSRGVQPREYPPVRRLNFI